MRRKTKTSIAWPVYMIVAAYFFTASDDGLHRVGGLLLSAEIAIAALAALVFAFLACAKLWVVGKKGFSKELDRGILKFEAGVGRLFKVDPRSVDLIFRMFVLLAILATCAYHSDLGALYSTVRLFIEILMGVTVFLAADTGENEAKASASSSSDPGDPT